MTPFGIPVVPEVYFKYYTNGASAIPVEEGFAPLQEEDMLILENVLSKYGNVDPWILVDITHSQKPWRNAYYNLGAKSIIPQRTIREYFNNERFRENS